MAVRRITVDCLEIEDKPGSLQGLLANLASVNVDLLCFAAFSAGGGYGKAYVSAKDSQALKRCVQELGIETTDAAGFIIVGEDRVGAAAEALKSLAEASINGVAGAAMVCNGQYRMLVIVDAADGDTAEEVLST